MAQYILLIEDNANSFPGDEEWNVFFQNARDSGIFRGGSAMGNREIFGNKDSARNIDFVAGYMIFESGDKNRILDLLETHPVVIHGGTVHLCELPRTP